MSQPISNTLSQATNFDTTQLPGNAYGYSGTTIDALGDGATEYTLATLVVDGSGSTGSFRREMQDAVGKIIVGCQRNPRADNMMLRAVEFSDNIREEHGFKMLSQCNPGDYANFMRLGGTTSLYDASDNSVAAMIDYAQKLTAQKYQVNAIGITITDGGDNASKLSIDAVKHRVEAALKNEALESLMLILIGINPKRSDGSKDTRLTQLLTDYATATGMRYIELDELTPEKFAKLAEFISNSISAQSQSLGTGGPSKPLNPSQLVM